MPTDIDECFCGGHLYWSKSNDELCYEYVCDTCGRVHDTEDLEKFDA